MARRAARAPPAGAHADTVTLRTELTVALGLLALCWLCAWALAARVRIEWVVAALVLVHVVYALGPPLSLTDLFNYLHYGREGARYGQNPYAALPLSVPRDAAYRFSNWHHLPSPYGPFFTLIAYALAPLPLHAAYWTWKAIAALASLGCLGARVVARASGSAARRSAPRLRRA